MLYNLDDMFVIVRFTHPNLSLSPHHANVVDVLKMHLNFKKCIYAYKIVCYSCLFYKYNLDVFKMRSNFKKYTYAYKIVCYSRLIYKYDLDAMLMLLMQKLRNDISCYQV